MGGYTKNPKDYKSCIDCGIDLLENQRHNLNGVFPLCYICIETRKEIGDQVIPLYSQMPKIWRVRRSMLDGRFTEDRENKIITEINEQIAGFKITKKSKLVKEMNDEKYIDGYIDGLSHALKIITRAAE